MRIQGAIEFFCAMITQTAEHRSGRLATSKSQCESYVCDFFFLFFFFAMMPTPLMRLTIKNNRALI